MILPGVIAGALVVFTLSVDEFVIAYFTAGTTVTFPIQVYSMIRFGVTPEINAVATIVVRRVSIVLVACPPRRLRGEPDGRSLVIARSRRVTQARSARCGRSTTSR